MRFDIEQTRLREKNLTIFSKAASRLKNILSGSVSTKDGSWREESKEEEETGCWDRFLGYFTYLLRKKKVRPEETH